MRCSSGASIPRAASRPAKFTAMTRMFVSDIISNLTVSTTATRHPPRRLTVIWSARCRLLTIGLTSITTRCIVITIIIMIWLFAVFDLTLQRQVQGRCQGAPAAEQGGRFRAARQAAIRRAAAQLCVRYDAPASTHSLCYTHHLTACGCS